MGEAKMDSTKVMQAARPPAPPCIWLRVLAAVLAAAFLLGAGAFLNDLPRHERRFLESNPLAQPGSAGSALADLFLPADGVFMPLARFTLFIQWRLHGEVAWPYRLLNLLFHFGSALLVYRLVRSLLPVTPLQSPAQDGMNSDAAFKPAAAVISGLGMAFFLLHPAQAHAVASVSARGLVQGVFFCALAWQFWTARGRSLLDAGRLLPPAAGHYALALLAYLCALLSTPVALGFLPVFLLTEGLWTSDRLLPRLLRMLGPALPALATAHLALSGPICHLGSAKGPLETAADGFWRAVLPYPELQLPAEPALAVAALILLCLAMLVIFLPVHWRPLVVLVSGIACLWALGCLPMGCPAANGPAPQSNIAAFALLPAGVLFGLAAEALHYRCRFLGLPHGKVVERVGFALGLLLCAAWAVLAVVQSFVPAAGGGS